MRQLNLFPPDITLQNGHFYKACLEPFDKLKAGSAERLSAGSIRGPLPEDAPVIVSNGVGVDSVALLIELHRRNIVPDAIVTALVGREWFGNEHRRFYKYLPILEQ